MIFLVAFIFFFLVTAGFFSFNEELLIILATVFWFDAAGSLFKSFLDAELVQKVDTIKKKFVWFLKLKKNLLKENLFFHKNRLIVSNFVVSFRETFFSLILVSLLLNYLKSNIAKLLYDRDDSLVLFGNGIQYDIMIKKLEDTTPALNFSITKVKLLDESYFVHNYSRAAYSNF